MAATAFSQVVANTTKPLIAPKSPGTALPHWHTTGYRSVQGYHSTGTNTPAFRVHRIRASSTVRHRSHAGIAAYALPGQRTLMADEPAVAEAYGVYPNDGYNPNLGHLCLSQQGGPAQSTVQT